VANVESDVYLEVWKSFRDNNIEIPFPQRDLHIRSGLPVLPS
jgi:small-conductance mechanosensitive channel